MAKKKATKRKAASAKVSAGKAAKKTAKKAVVKKTASKKPVKKGKSSKNIAKKAKPAKKKNAPVKVSLRKIVKKKAAKKAPLKKIKPAFKKKVSSKKSAPKKAAVKNKIIKTGNHSSKKIIKPAKKNHFIDVIIDTPILETIALNYVEAAPVFKQHVTSLREGMLAPYFEGLDQHGNLIRSSDFLGKTVILYFYPKDFTEGCTAEACSLRDEYQYLENNNYVVIGVSADSVDSHKEFADELNLPYSLISDTDHAIINAYDVWGPKQLAGKFYDGIVRTTFVIDADGIIKNVVTKVDSAHHAQQLLNL